MGIVEHNARMEWDMGPRDIEAPLLNVIPSKVQLNALLAEDGREAFGMLQGPFNILFACALLEDYQEAKDSEGNIVFPDIRIVSQDKGFNTVYVEKQIELCEHGFVSACPENCN